MTPIFNGLQPSKMAVHPCTARSKSKNGVFQLAAGISSLESLTLDRQSLALAVYFVCLNQLIETHESAS